jgi:ribonucleoside-diphosphate reductase alpha chain
VTGLGPNKVLSVPDAIGIAMEKWMQDKHGIQQDLLDDAPAQEGSTVSIGSTTVSRGGGEMMQLDIRGAEQHAGACPDCGSQLEFAEGCVKCHVCGYSECG